MMIPFNYCFGIDMSFRLHSKWNLALKSSIQQNLSSTIKNVFLNTLWTLALILINYVETLAFASPNWLLFQHTFQFPSTRPSIPIPFSSFKLKKSLSFYILKQTFLDISSQIYCIQILCINMNYFFVYICINWPCIVILTIQ
jgi:hypothetical protein